MQDEPDHAEGARDADLAVGGDRREVAQHRAAGPDDELADAGGLVLAAGRILRPEPLVIVVVAVDDDVRPGPVERVPERPDRGVVAVHARAEPRVVPDRHRALGGRSLRGRLEPATLRRNPAGSRRRTRSPSRGRSRATPRGRTSTSSRRPARPSRRNTRDTRRVPWSASHGSRRPAWSAPGDDPRSARSSRGTGSALPFGIGVVAGGEDGALDRVEERRRRRRRSRARNRRCRRPRRGPGRPMPRGWRKPEPTGALAIAWLVAPAASVAWRSPRAWRPGSPRTG